MSDMDQQPSEYLQYLPPFFREAAGDGTAAGEFLSNLLLGFQKILTGVKNNNGIEDDIKIEDRSGERIYEPLEAVIDQLDRFFDPFRTDLKFLEWLASWVALELRPDWTPAEQRKMIARMVQISRRIGLKAGLYDYLDIYAKEAIRPRVSIDDDEAVFRVVLRGDGPAAVNVLAFAKSSSRRAEDTDPVSPLRHRGARKRQARACPLRRCRRRTDPPRVSSRTRSVSLDPRANGELDDTHWVGPGPNPATSPPTLQPLNSGEPDDKANGVYRLSAPVAVVAEDQESLLVLDQGHDYTKGNHAPPSIFRYPRFPGKFRRELVFRLASPVNESHPIDMILDSGANPKRLVVLDHPKNKKPRLLFIKPVERSGAGSGLSGLDEIELKDSITGKEIVVTPTAIVQESANTFVIADARDDGSTEMGRGVLVRVTIEESTPRRVSYESWDSKRGREQSPGLPRLPDQGE